MSVETATYISQLNPTLPSINDPKAEGDDHLRLTKSVLQNQFPNLGAAAVTPTAADLNVLAGAAAGAISGLQVATQVATDASTKAASTAMVQAAILASSGISASLPAQAGNSGKYLTTNGSTPSWGSIVGGMTLLATLNPANGVTNVSATNLPSSKSLLIVTDNPGLSASANMLVAVSSNNGSSYDSNFAAFTNNSTTPNGFLQLFRTDSAGSNKPYAGFSSGGTVNGTVTDTTGIINAIKITPDSSQTFNGTGAIYIYGMN